MLMVVVGGVPTLTFTNSGSTGMDFAAIGQSPSGFGLPPCSAKETSVGHRSRPSIVDRARTQVTGNEQESPRFCLKYQKSVLFSKVPDP